ncbi:NfeD family protein [Hyperthermus butylicus]
MGSDVWSATTRGKPIPRGTKVRVVGVEGVHLIVEPVEEA